MWISTSTSLNIDQITKNKFERLNNKFERVNAHMRPVKWMPPHVILSGKERTVWLHLCALHSSLQSVNLQHWMHWREAQSPQEAWSWSMIDNNYNTVSTNLFITEGIDVCRAHSDRSLQYCARDHSRQTQRVLDALLVGNESRMAAAVLDDSMALFCVDTEPVALVQLSCVQLAGDRLAFFCGDMMLVGVANGIYNYHKVREAVSFTTTDGRLQRDCQIISRNHRLVIFCCFLARHSAREYISGEQVLINALLNQFYFYNCLSNMLFVTLFQFCVMLIRAGVNVPYLIVHFCRH